MVSDNSFKGYCCGKIYLWNIEENCGKYDWKNIKNCEHSDTIRDKVCTVLSWSAKRLKSFDGDGQSEKDDGGDGEVVDAVDELPEVVVMRILITVMVNSLLDYKINKDYLHTHNR